MVRLLAAFSSFEGNPSTEPVMGAVSVLLS